MEAKPLMNLSFPIVGGDFTQAGEASSRIKRALQQIGIDPALVRRVAVSTYEAEMNIVIHAWSGELTLTIWPTYIEVVADDKGPGISNLELAMQEGFSTAPDRVRELGFGAGMGLPNIQRSSDELQVDTQVGQGTRVTMKINL